MYPILYSAKATERENGAAARLKKSSNESRGSEKSVPIQTGRNKGQVGPSQNSVSSSPPKSPKKSKFR